MSEDKYRAALDAAAKQLSCRALSAKMLRGKLLAKGHDEEAADYALAWLTERSLLSDGAVRGERRAQLCPAQGLRRGAHPSGAFPARHFTARTADAAMQTFSPDLAQMLALLEKRLRGDVSDRKEVDKAVAALQRRGFSWSDIKNALEEYGASLDIDE